MLASFNTDRGPTSARDFTLGAAEPQGAVREPGLAELCFLEAKGDPLLALDLACSGRPDPQRSGSIPA